MIKYVELFVYKGVENDIILVGKYFISKYIIYVYIHSICTNIELFYLQIYTQPNDKVVR